MQAGLFVTCYEVIFFYWKGLIVFKGNNTRASSRHFTFSKLTDKSALIPTFRPKTFFSIFYINYVDNLNELNAYMRHQGFLVLIYIHLC